MIISLRLSKRQKDVLIKFELMKKISLLSVTKYWKCLATE